MLESLFVLLAFQLMGTTVGLALKLPIPGPVLGFALLASWMLLKFPLPEAMGTTASTLLQHLSLLFVPAATGMIQHLERLLVEGWALLLSVVLSTTLALIVGALTFVLMVRWTRAYPTSEEVRHD